ncbi:hypothetical protein [Erythrobacter sp. JK5]|uniref:hypothetical protein n=1 Tax=Erythrobacter sp. JK5 TaxID=2829500 RepID=UPI001BAA0718|nr:hypothetical protein [Erythrobacter sp. JK5]QUL38549.1 hypothetical protein KDC96_03895 [Erythrobacter sp. JK5]
MKQDRAEAAACDRAAVHRRLRSKRQFLLRASSAFLVSCFGLGVVALLTPIVLPLIAAEPSPTISHFYHDPVAGDVFVGMLSATGVFLFFFQGLSRIENALLSAAGIFLLLVVFVPVAPETCTDPAFNWHGAFALMFFACLAVVAIFFAKNRLEHIEEPSLRTRIRHAYNLAGLVMILGPATAFAIHQSSGVQCSDWIYRAEAVATLGFALFWFTKTFEYKKLMGLNFTRLLVNMVSLR